MVVGVDDVIVVVEVNPKILGVLVVVVVVYLVVVALDVE